MADSPNPRVTFVVPAFNEAPSVMAESFASIVAQDFGDFECLVIDESTRPESIAACQALCSADRRFRRIVPPSRIGLAASLNLGIAEARGEYIARFDSDDICVPLRLSRQVATLDAAPQIGVLGGGLRIVDTNGQKLAVRAYPVDHATIARRFHSTTPVAHPTAMVRKTVFEAVGVYDPAFRFAEDLDLWLRFLNAGVLFANLPETLVHYRQNATQRHLDHWRFNLRARCKNFARQDILRRIVGIGAISVWRYMPPRVQAAVFKSLLLKTT